METDESVRPKAAWRYWGIGVAVAALPLLADIGAISRAAGLHALAEGGGSPYFVPAHLVLLWVWAPLVALSAFAVVLAPGLLAVAALGSARSLSDWIGQGCALSFVWVSALGASLDGLGGDPTTGGAFVAACLASSVLGILACAQRQRQSAAALAMVRERPAFAFSCLCVPLVLMAALSPKIHWESFNGDGAHMFLAAKLLLFQPLPFWPEGSGVISGFPGMTTFVSLFPASWFIRVFGEWEASVRLPMFMVLPWLFAAVLSVIEVGKQERLTGSQLWLVWLAIVAFALTQVFSATYDPYSSDIALPAAQDILLMALWMFAVRYFLEGRLGWMTLYAALVYGVAANGAMMIAFWLCAAVLCLRPLPVRPILGLLGALVLAVVVAALAPGILDSLGHPAPGTEHGLTSLLRRFAFLQLTDLRRVLFFVVPCGIVPVLAMIAWRQQDGVARAFSLFTLAYFAFFYFQAYVSLHYFVPVMITPLVVLWRSPEPIWLGKWRSPAILLGGVLAVGLALPQHGDIATAARTVGGALEDRLPGYEGLEPAAVRRADLLHELLPSDWRPAVPHESYGGSPLAWYYYSKRLDGKSSVPPAYVIAPSAERQPGWDLVASNGEASLFVADPQTFAAHRALRPSTPAGSVVYDIPRSMLFFGLPSDKGPRIWNVIDVLERFGIDSNRILEALGIETSD